MQTIVAKGKDVQDAIIIGLNTLGVNKDEVDIEIIQSNEKGFLGLGTKKAVVKLTIQKGQENRSNNSHDSSQQILNDGDKPREEDLTKVLQPQEKVDDSIHTLEGKVWVKDGRLYCRDSPTRFPLVTIQEGLRLMKNGQSITEETTIVSEAHHYEIEVDSLEERETKWSIKIDKQGLIVLLTVEPGYTITRSLQDVVPDYHIDVKVDEKKEIINSLTQHDVINELKSLGINEGYDIEEIIKATSVEEPSTFEIATGKSPTDGNDGWIEYLVNLQGNNEFLEKEDGRIDYKEVQTFPAVDRGAVIGIIHRPIPGESGYTVQNELIPAPKVYPVIVRPGNGIIIEENKIVATASGRPQVEQRGKLITVAVKPKLVHQGNVDLESGNIRFIGDVEIVGEVNNMVVEAEGEINVHKLVNKAILTTSGSIITYGNIVGSEISAGKNNMLQVELGHLLGSLYQQTEKLLKVVNELMLSPAFKSSDLSNGGLKPLIRILLEKKFQSFPSIAKKYVEVVRKGETYLDEEWKEVAISLNHLFLSLTNEVISIERIEQLSQKMKKLNEESDSPIDQDSFITVPNVLKSKIYCSGNVLIVGKSCTHSTIHAGGSLKVKGALRGGEVYGRLGVDINEVGAESGVTTLISVPSDQTIKINKAMEGTTIKIGKSKYTFQDVTYEVVAYLDNEGNIAFKS
ncbi:flagellar assembly protein A [Bacillus salitolerans]|uniref:Flagellar assembly protein A n=1 Tax=Bacillus salitolerans TaxID=1437434 RepID=A0ABW4LSQ5_9BACI